MSTFTINIPDDIMQKLEAQNQPLQALLLQALNEYLCNQYTTDPDVENPIITVDLYKNFDSKKKISDGQKMADALTQIVLSNSLREIDPITWQREIRTDRPLPDRD